MLRHNIALRGHHEIMSFRNDESMQSSTPSEDEIEEITLAAISTFKCVTSGDEQVEVPQHKKELLHQLADHSYADVCADRDDELKHTSLVRQSNATGDSRSIRQPCKQIPSAKRKQAQKFVQERLQQDVIQPSNSPWASTVVLVQKKDGSYHFCVDYHKLNAVTHKEAYPLPRIDESLEGLSESQLFSTLDLLSGYWQVEMSEEDCQKTAFVTCDGLFEFKVMSFGLCNALATFQDIVLSGI
eukprot:Em0009g778a